MWVINDDNLRRMKAMLDCANEFRGTRSGMLHVKTHLPAEDEAPDGAISLVFSGEFALAGSVLEEVKKMMNICDRFIVEHPDDDTLKVSFVIKNIYEFEPEPGSKEMPPEEEVWSDMLIKEKSDGESIVLGIDTETLNSGSGKGIINQTQLTKFLSIEDAAEKLEKETDNGLFPADDKIERVRHEIPDDEKKKAVSKSLSLDLEDHVWLSGKRKELFAEMCALADDITIIGRGEIIDHPRISFGVYNIFPDGKTPEQRLVDILEKFDEKDIDDGAEDAEE